MTSKRVELTHPKIPGSSFSVFAQQVELWAKRGWEVVTGDKPEPTTPAKKSSASKTPAPAPADSSKEV